MKKTATLIALTLTLTMLSACGSKDTSKNMDKKADMTQKEQMQAKNDPTEGMRVLYHNEDRPQNDKIKHLKLEHAATIDQKTTGLAGRESLGAEEGMIFDFERAGQHRFWMKGMLFPLDIMYVAGDGTIVDIVTLEVCEVEVCPTYVPKAIAQFVIEVNKGYVESHGLEIGDVINPALFLQ